LFFDWIPERYDGEYGRCLRGPPQFIEPGALNGGWPVVKKEEWCGEHAEHSNDEC